DPVGPTVVVRNGNHKKLALCVTRDGGKGSGMARGIISRWTKYISRNNDEREICVAEFLNNACSSFETLDRSRDLLPWPAPQVFILVGARQQSLNLRQHQFIGARIISNWTAG